MSGKRGTGAFSTRVIVALLIIGVFSFSAFITLSTFAPEMRRGDNGQAHALSRSAIGYAGLVQLMRSLEINTSVNRKPEGNEGIDLVILTPRDKVTREQLKRLGGYATLIVLPKWWGSSDYEHPGWISGNGLSSEPEVADVLSELAPKAKVTRATAKSRARFELDGESHVSGEIDGLQSVSGDGLEPVIKTATGGVLLARVSKENAVYVLADPDLLNTQGIANLDTARAGLTIVNWLRSDGSAVFDVTLNGLETGRSLLRVALTPPLIGATLALFAAAMLLGWRVIMQAGPRAQSGRAIALGKKALAENSAALIRLAGREHTMGWRYAVLTATAAAEQIGAPRTEATETFAMLDRVGASQHMSTSYSTLADQAAHAQTPADVVAAARHLYAWTEEMLRAAR